MLLHNYIAWVITILMISRDCLEGIAQADMVALIHDRIRVSDLQPLCCTTPLEKRSIAREQW
jgi:hypothetical protein